MSLTIANSGDFESTLSPSAPIVNPRCSLQRLFRIRPVAYSAYFEYAL
jgi:hypothetical protein